MFHWSCWNAFTAAHSSVILAPFIRRTKQTRAVTLHDTRTQADNHGATFSSVLSVLIYPRGAYLLSKQFEEQVNRWQVLQRPPCLKTNEVSVWIVQELTADTWQTSLMWRREAWILSLFELCHEHKRIQKNLTFKETWGAEGCEGHPRFNKLTFCLVTASAAFICHVTASVLQGKR